MKKTHKYFCLLVMGMAMLLISCEENDPLGDLGTVVGDKVPFVTISGMDAIYPAKDTIVYDAIYWTVNDDIEKLALLQGERIALKGSLTVDDGGGAITVSFEDIVETEIAQIGDFIAHDPIDYVTSRNAYTKRLEYIIPSEYQLLELKEASMLANVDGIAHAAELKTLILDRLAENGIAVDWAGLDDIATEVDLKIESTLSFQIRAYNQTGFNDSSVREVIVGALEE